MRAGAIKTSKHEDFGEREKKKTRSQRKEKGPEKTKDRSAGFYASVHRVSNLESATIVLALMPMLDR